MLITKDFFYKDNCCSSIIQFLLEEDQRKVELVFENNFRNISEKDKRNTKLIIDDTFRNHFFHWFNDNITAVMNKKQCVQYAIYAVELVLPIFEDRFPNDKRPRKAIEAAKKCIDDPSEENIQSTYTVRSNAYSTASYASYAASASSAKKDAVKDIRLWIGVVKINTKTIDHEYKRKIAKGLVADMIDEILGLIKLMDMACDHKRSDILIAHERCFVDMVEKELDIYDRITMYSFAHEHCVDITF